MNIDVKIQTYFLNIKNRINGKVATSLCRLKFVKDIFPPIKYINSLIFQQKLQCIFKLTSGF